MKKTTWCQLPLKISSSTVSKVLNQKPGISKSTVQAANVTASKLNYRPNFIAISLRQYRSDCKINKFEQTTDPN
ncbi:LacI family DNA-binding transcriptional regulator [Fulvivirga sp. M361]|uniref:LacI family DNA-binding transcriptional regulator n=1 Tax=Fulvivirga sp. M361 TaxID=2594266 RepID=UPI00117B36A7|nr:LacI family DNA-binding transcriptional regulator [Fulvivirga sp. M361]